MCREACSILHEQLVEERSSMEGTNYAGETNPPTIGVEPLAVTWKLFYLGGKSLNDFTTPGGKNLKI